MTVMVDIHISLYGFDFCNSEAIMEYLTTAELSKIWNISQRRIAILCKEGRVNGAILKGKTWLVPSTSKKPVDPRKLKSKESNGQ